MELKVFAYFVNVLLRVLAFVLLGVAHDDTFDSSFVVAPIYHFLFSEFVGPKESVTQTILF